MDRPEQPEGRSAAHAGNHHFQWSPICAKFGWDEDGVCGPQTMTGGRGDKCPYGHQHHVQPKVGGKPFAPQDHWAELKKEGLITFQEELKKEREADKPPPGKPTKGKGGALIYPARHFA